MQVLQATEPIIRRVTWEPTDGGRQSLVWKEWLVTNGLGGYSSGTVAGAMTRRYHGLLIAALSTPFGRTMMFNHLWETLRWPDGRVVPLYDVTTTADGKEMSNAQYLVGFYLEDGLPVWTYDVDGVRFEKRVLMPYLQNTTHITYHLLSGGPVRLELRPLLPAGGGRSSLVRQRRHWNHGGSDPTVPLRSPAQWRPAEHPWPSDGRPA